jgi:hypothetical protein
MIITAPVAQWTEQWPSKPLVVGSNPAGGAVFSPTIMLHNLSIYMVLDKSAFAHWG